MVSDELGIAQHASVPASLVAASLAGYTRQNNELSPLLEHAQLDAQTIVSTKRLSLNQFSRLLQSTYNLMGDEAAGFLPRRLPVGTFAMMCHATITCPNLRRVFLRCAQFMKIVNSDIRYDLEENGEEARLVLNLHSAENVEDSFFQISLLIILVRWCSWLLDQPILLERADFAFSAPSYGDELNMMFPCRHYFDQKQTAIVFSSHYLTQPLAQNPLSLSEFLAHAPSCLLTHYKNDNSISALVRKILQHDDSVGFQQVADQLHMSAATLRRRLKEERASFQQLKDSIKRDLAIFHLRQMQMPIADIAELIGFSEPSPFNRAFKKWTGTTPGAYREALLDARQR